MSEGRPLEDGFSGSIDLTTEKSAVRGTYMEEYLKERALKQ